MTMSISERNAFVLKNLGLTKKIAKDFSFLNTTTEDLEQDAVEKFLLIADRYDEKRGCSISTYIWPHLKNHLFENNCQMPESLRKHASNISKAREELSKEMKSVSDEDIADFLGISEKRIRKYNNQIKQYSTLSLDYEFNNSDGDNYCLLETELDNPELSPEEIYLKKEEKRIIQNAWTKLSEEERKILTCRTTYGSSFSEPMSLRDAAKYLGSNRTTIAAKEKQAVMHLKRLLEKEGICA